MNTKQSGIILNKMERPLYANRVLGLFLLIFQSVSVCANNLSMTGINIAALPGGRLQIQMKMNGAAFEPKVFQTDNPARIALDFSGVKNALEKKLIPVNQGSASSIYVAEAADRGFGSSSI
jgi:type IV pilus assembly protein PilQ